ncbi:MAG: hypothetical protein IJS09_09905 [Treponema sp.]|nr:hypothetical protein [Treponema sp.]
MSEKQLEKIALSADMIINNYAFTRKNGTISVLNLRKPNRAMILSESGKMLETNMDEIEQVIVQNIWKKDSEYMEKVDA